MSSSSAVRLNPGENLNLKNTTPNAVVVKAVLPDGGCFEITLHPGAKMTFTQGASIQVDLSIYTGDGPQPLRAVTDG